MFNELKAYPTTLDGMTYEVWSKLPEHVKLKLRDRSSLTPELIPYEHDRVEVTYPDGGKYRYWVGLSTGWRPVHIETLKINSTGGNAVYWPAGTTVVRVREGKRR